jgi:transcriptional regulator with XRE-family HTH domain
MLLRVREFRKRAGLRQLDLATRSQCSRELISAIETDRYSPTVAVLGRIADALHVPLWSLFEDDDLPSDHPEPPPGGHPLSPPVTRLVALCVPLLTLVAA